MRDALLQHVSFRFADLTAATLDKADLRGAHLSSNSQSDPALVPFASFRQADFSEAELSWVDFSGDDLAGAHFTRDTLRGTSFVRARLSSTDFSEASLDDVKFKGAELFSSKFNAAHLTRPTTGVIGAGSDLSCAGLGGADFTNAQVDYANFKAAVMPTEQDCCPGPGGAMCGFSPSDGQPYHATILPKTTSATITCPNGDHGPCVDVQWKLSSDWSTTLCSSSGQSERLWSKPSCSTSGGGHQDGTQGVVFGDRALQQCVQDHLHLHGAITQAEADRVTTLDCSAMQIGSVQGIEQLRNLVSLRLTGNQLISFSVTGVGLPHLTSLDVTANQLTSLSLLRLPKLKHLNAARNRLETVQFFEPDLGLLESLDLSSNQLATIDLSAFTALNSADLSANRLTNIVEEPSVGLGSLQKLTELDLDENSLQSIGSIQSLIASKSGTGGKLERLTLSCNPRFSCKSLESNDGDAHPALLDTGCVRRDAGNTKQWTFRPSPDCVQ